MDDSIVRGTTLEKSIIEILDRLKPKKILVVSSAPQIRYPDCYGIDMSRMQDFVAFRALLKLIENNNREDLLEMVHAKCKENEGNFGEDGENYVRALYDEFSTQEITEMIGEIIVGEGISADVAGVGMGTLISCSKDMSIMAPLSSIEGQRFIPVELADLVDAENIVRTLCDYDLKGYRLSGDRSYRCPLLDSRDTINGLVAI